MKQLAIIGLIAFIIFNWELFAALGILALLFAIYAIFTAIF